MPFNDSPILSTSLSEFWGRRYNKLMSAFFRFTIFDPLRERGFSAAEASMVSFATSGLIHMYVAQTVFGGGLAPAFAFFVVHGIGIAVER